MLNQIISSGSISFFLVFLEGLLSFFSPCVLPLLPIYFSYLAGNSKQTDEEGVINFQRKKVFFHTIFFVLGISSAFFILGMSISALGIFFKSNQLLFTRIGGVLIIAMGLVQIGLLDLKFLQRERKFHFNFGARSMSPLLAFVLGFTFSFAWTPCVGPALSSVLIMASGTGKTLTGNLLVLVYSIGFIVPFLLLGLFTTQVLNFLKAKQKLLRYTVKIGGVILILIGIMTFTGWMNGVSRYLNSFTPQSNTGESFEAKESEGISSTPNSSSSGADSVEDDSINNNDTANNNDPNSNDTANNNDTASNDTPQGNTTDENSDSSNQKNDEEPVAAYDFTLTDQYGNEHTLSDYKGKVVFLNFWATWCGPCKEEIPDIEALYKEYNKNQEDIIILGVANPASSEYPNNADVSKTQIQEFLEKNEYTFPVVFDETGEILSKYYISSFPTTFMIDKEGNIFGYAPGMLTKDMMQQAIQQTLDSTE
jgi:cytochrome c-type biogenesis protein